MKIVTAAQMQETDLRAIDEFNLSTNVLMESAGSAVSAEIIRILDDVKGKKIFIYAGKGNNGGDGFVVARYLANMGAKVKVYLLAAKADIKGAASDNLEVLAKMNIDVVEILSERDWDKFRVGLTFTDCIVDAILGTGIKGKISEKYAMAIELINRANKKVFAIDIPSGINADTGQLHGHAIKASYTITLSLPKIGLELYPGKAHSGQIIVKDIGIPYQIQEDLKPEQNLITKAIIKKLLPKRNPDSYKGMNGHVLIFAGSKGYTGAASLCALGSLRAGAGLVTLAVPEDVYEILACKMTEAITRPIVLNDSKTAIGLEGILDLHEQMKKSNVVAIGPGLGNGLETFAAIREFIKDVDKPLVIDADALNALVNHLDLIKCLQCLPILTPHIGEFSRLIGQSITQINENRIEIVREEAIKLQSIIVLKGAPTIIAFPDGDIYINTTGNESMATGGSGDVLTGIIASLVGQGCSMQDAAILGVYIQGLAAELASQRGKVGILPSDLINFLPVAIDSIINDR